MVPPICLSTGSPFCTMMTSLPAVLSLNNTALLFCLFFLLPIFLMLIPNLYVDRCFSLELSEVDIGGSSSDISSTTSASYIVLMTSSTFLYTSCFFSCIVLVLSFATSLLASLIAFCFLCSKKVIVWSV